MINWDENSLKRCMAGQMIGIDKITVNPSEFSNLINPASFSHQSVFFSYTVSLDRNLEQLFLYGSKVKILEETKDKWTLTIDKELVPYSFLVVYNPRTLQSGRVFHSQNDSFLHRHLDSSLNLAEATANRLRGPYDLLI